jgi:xanthine dehydrogenase accessory factor
MIGSKRKIKLIFEDLLTEGISREALERIHAPLGFDIGSQTVPEIAISIVAELIACRNLGEKLVSIQRANLLAES